MGGLHSKRGVEGIITEGQGFGMCLHDRRRARRSLGDHLTRGLHGGHIAGSRLVGSSASSYIDDASRLAEAPFDRPGDTRVGSAAIRIAAPEPVVSRFAHLVAIEQLPVPSDLPSRFASLGFRLLGPRRGAGVVERGSLENCWRRKALVGSNPTPSALS